MRKPILSWGLILSLLLTLLPVPTMAAESEPAGDSLSVTESTQCTCGAEPDETGIIVHADGCPLAVQEEPVPGVEEPAQGTEEPASAAAPAISLTTNSVTVTESEMGLDEPWLREPILFSFGAVTISPNRINAAIPGTYPVTYTASADGFADATAALTVTVLPRPTAQAMTAHGSHSSWRKLTENTDSLSGQVYLETDITAGGALTVNSAVTLCLNGHVLNLNGNNIAVGSGGSLTICDCNAQTEHGFTENRDGLWVLEEPGSETVYGGVITGGKAVTGGAILVDGGNLTLESGTLAGCHADKGGGVYVTNGTFTMTGGTITGNLADGTGSGSSGENYAGGGGVYVSADGQFTMSGGSIEHNTMPVSAQNDGGGGVLIDTGSFTMSGGTIRENAAVKQTRDGSGGGVYLSRGNFTMSAGTISGNQAASGGGVFVFGRQDAYANFQLSGGSITGNDASASGGGVYLSPPLYNGTFSLSGAPDISGNTAGSEKADANIYLSNNVITLAAHLPKGTNYGVSLSAGQGPITSGWTTHMNGEDPTQYFTPETEGAIVMLVGDADSQEAALHIHRYIYAADDETDIITETCACGHSATATLSVPEGPYYANADGSPVTPATVTYSSNWVGEQPEVTYQNNTAAGNATASLTIGGKTVSANFTIEKPLPIYTVTFDANGHGNPPETQAVQQGGKVTEPTVPTVDGYTFEGWYNGETKWNFETDPVTTDLTLTAKWTLNTYTIHYELKGGSLAQGQSNPESYTVTTGEITLWNPTRPGYTFAGWTEGDGTTPQQTVTIPQGSTGNKTYTAHWTLDSPTVALSASKTQVTYGEDIVLTAQIVSHDGVTYSCQWYQGGTLVANETDATLTITNVADSGSYHVVVTAQGDGQTQESASDSVTVDIMPLTVVLAWNYTAPIPYDGQEHAVAATISNLVNGDSCTLTYQGNQTATTVGHYQVEVTALGNPNYTLEDVANTRLEWKIVPASGAASVTHGTGDVTYRYTGTSAGGVSYDSADVPTDAGNYTVTATFAATANYEEVTATDTFTIAPRSAELRWDYIDPIPYDGQAHTVAAAVDNGVGGDAFDLEYTGNTATDAGSYEAAVTDLGNPNYTLDGATGSTLTWEITKAQGAASVTMKGWTYGDAAEAPVPTSATHGTDHVTYRYTGTTAGGAGYDSDGIPTHAGSYTVTATFPATENYEAITATAKFTIAQRAVTAAWLGLDQVYGDKAEVQVKLSGIVDGDKVSAEVNKAIPDDAGSYTLTAALIGDSVSNYTLNNSTATLTIQPRLVLFAVKENAMQADGNVKNATVTADDKTCTYIVTYLQNGKQVDAPKETGSYEIWVEITNTNYRHANGGDQMQVGTLTITQAPPVVYTASFAGGGSATGTAPAPQTAISDSQVTLPANPFNRPGYCFTGWKADGDARIYQPGDRFTMPARNVTITAQWQEAFQVDGTITEKIDGTATPTVANAVVSLWLGANKIGEVTTDTKGNYTFGNLIPGIYNLVVTKDVRTVTSKVEIKDANAACNATLPKGATNSIVEVIPGSPDLVVGNLDTVFDKTDEEVYTQADQDAVDAGGKVEITFTAEEKQSTDVSGDLAKIQAVSGESTLVLVMDCKLEKTVTLTNGIAGQPTPITQSNVLLEVLLPLPAELQGKQNYSVYRVHNGQAQELKQGKHNQNELGEYFTVSSDKTGLFLYVKCFSTYAIGYSDTPVTPTPPDSGSGSGGGGSTPVYPPNTEPTEHGSITTDPKNPQKGDKVTIHPTPEEGFTVDEVIVTGPNGRPVAVTPNDDGTYTFTQPAGKVTITVTFRQLSDVSDCPRDESCPLTPFADADRNAWYHDGVHYCVEHGLMMGTSKTAFAPDIPITRGMIVTILWRLEGSPLVSTSLDYDDVKPENWYGEAVRWADSAGVVMGYGNGTFGPNDPISREQMATMLWRYAGSPRVDGSFSFFADGAQTSSWAQPAMLWAVEQGLIVGVSNERLNPRGQATRAQAATILMRFAKNMAQ